MLAINAANESDVYHPYHTILPYRTCTDNAIVIAQPKPVCTKSTIEVGCEKVK